MVNINLSKPVSVKYAIVYRALRHTAEDKKILLLYSMCLVDSSTGKTIEKGVESSICIDGIAGTTTTTIANSTVAPGVSQTPEGYMDFVVATDSLAYIESLCRTYIMPLYGEQEETV